VKAANSVSAELANKISKLKDYIWTSTLFFGPFRIIKAFLVLCVSNLIWCKKNKCITNIAMLFEFFNNRCAFVRLAVEYYGFNS